jgi:hypothetical protein
MPGEQRQQVGEVRRRPEGVADVARVAQEVLGRRPDVEHHDRVPPGEVRDLRRLAGGALDRRVGAVDVDEHVAGGPPGERSVDRRQPGGRLGRRLGSGGQGRRLVHPLEMHKRPVVAGAGRPLDQLVERRAFAEPGRGGAEVQLPVRRDGVGAVVDRPDRQPVRGIEERNAVILDERRDVESGEARVLEQQRRRHQPHRRVMQDEEGDHAGGDDQQAEAELAHHPAIA